MTFETYVFNVSKGCSMIYNDVLNCFFNDVPVVLTVVHSWLYKCVNHMLNDYFNNVRLTLEYLLQKHLMVDQVPSKLLKVFDR